MSCYGRGTIDSVLLTVREWKQDVSEYQLISIFDSNLLYLSGQTRRPNPGVSEFHSLR